jgi:hypothetical protein
LPHRTCRPSGWKSTCGNRKEIPESGLSLSTSRTSNDR